MRNLLIFLMLLLAGNICSITYADPLPLIKGGQSDSIPLDDGPLKGHRAPVAPIMCDIDWNAETISIFGYDTEDIQSYEIWNEEGDVCLYSTGDKAEFFAQAKSLNTPCLIVFVFDDFTLFGYIN